MVSESKYTSWPSGPAGSKVATLLTAKLMAMPSATGRSMPMRPWRRSRSAPRKKGPQEKTSTGRLSTHEAQRSNCALSAASSPGRAVYAG